MTAAPYPRLLADVGGTNARFAWQDTEGAEPHGVRVYPAADHPTLQAAMVHFLADSNRPAPAWGAIGIANPVTGDQVQMTNHHWSFSISALRDAMGMQRLVVVNDFTALALALPLLDDSEKLQVGGGDPVPGTAIGLIGPGTGLGVSGLVRGEGRWVPLDSEGGHVSLAPATAREWQVVAALHQRFGHASAERAVSGQGLVWLYEALCQIDGAPVPAGLSGATVTGTAVDGSDPRSVETLSLFFAFLGATAGNLALTLGARGGVYIGGGIVPRLAAQLQASSFRERFEAKGRFAGMLAAMPVYVITSTQSPALRGASCAL